MAAFWVVGLRASTYSHKVDVIRVDFGEDGREVGLECQSVRLHGDIIGA